MQRPGGVTALAILSLIGGVLSLIGGFAFIGLRNQISTNNTVGITGSVAVIFGLLLIAGAIFSIAFAIGAFRGAGWAWLLGVIGQVLNLISYVANLVSGATHNQFGQALGSNILGLLISGGILTYLNSAQVKHYFGRA